MKNEILRDVERVVLQMNVNGETRELLVPPTSCPPPPLQRLFGLVAQHGIRPVTAMA